MDARIEYLRDQLRYPWIICFDRAPTSHVAQFPIDTVDLDQSPRIRGAFIRVTEMRLHLEDFDPMNIEAMSRRDRANDYGCQMGYLGPATLTAGARCFAKYDFVIIGLHEYVVCSDTSPVVSRIFDREVLYRFG
ncbi:MAG: hypothetical protein KBC33_03350 [Candidatus Pacebacteria bacterium]|nr:hypothetical protein [Candidatus Paceibacterota bacterium]